MNVFVKLTIDVIWQDSEVREGNGGRDALRFAYCGNGSRSLAVTCGGFLFTSIPRTRLWLAEGKLEGIQFCLLFDIHIMFSVSRSSLSGAANRSATHIVKVWLQD